MSGKVYVVDGARTPFLKAKSKPGSFSGGDLAVGCARPLLARQKFSPTEFDEVIVGAAMPSADEANIGRVVSLRLGCGDKVPAWTVMRNCASGMQALDSACMNILAGKSNLGGVSQRGPKVTDALDKVAYDYINTHGKDLHGMPLGKYFIHSLGHSVGIDVHDPMDYTKPLDKGMVFTIEPGIYIPEEKIGVRIEDVYYVSEDGKLIDLIANLPHDAADIEAAMRH